MTNTFFGVASVLVTMISSDLRCFYLGLGVARRTREMTKNFCQNVLET